MEDFDGDDAPASRAGPTHGVLGVPTKTSPSGRKMGDKMWVKEPPPDLAAGLLGQAGTAACGAELDMESDEEDVPSPSAKPVLAPPAAAPAKATSPEREARHAAAIEAARKECEALEMEDFDGDDAPASRAGPTHGVLGVPTKTSPSGRKMGDKMWVKEP